MKALVCASCMDIRALEPTGQWTVCRCGACEARWLDPDAGTVRVRTVDRSLPRILGLNNRFLVSAVKGLTHEFKVAAGGQDEAWRELHKLATHAPGYVFDEAKRACWACIVKVNETGDIAWEADDLLPAHDKGDGPPGFPGAIKLG